MRNIKRELKFSAETSNLQWLYRTLTPGPLYGTLTTLTLTWACTSKPISAAHRRFRTVSTYRAHEFGQSLNYIFYLRPVFRLKCVIIKYCMSNKTFLKTYCMGEELYKFNVILRWFSTVCYPDHWIISSELLVPISVIFWAPLKGR